MAQSGDVINSGQRDNMKKPLIPYRYFMLVMIFITTVVVLSVRNVINVAIIAMVERSNTSQATAETFDWNQHDQGIVLGSYYYTYAAIQIVAGALTDKFNAVHLMIGAQILATLCTFATPIAAKMGLIYLAGARMIIGLVHGVTYPALYNMIEKWFLPNEIGLAQGLMTGGGDIGNALVMLFAAWISQKNLWGGWPAAFYIIAIVNALFLILWTIMVTVDPQSNKFVSEYEKKLLTKNGSKNGPKRQKPTPWIKLCTSIPLWSIVLTKGLIGTAYSVIQTKIPVYLSSCLGYDITNNGAINAMIYIAVAFSQLICGPISNYIITKGWLTKIVTRKLFESIALSGIMASLITICYSANHPNLIIACLIVAMFSYGFNLGGDVPIIPEMAPALVGSAFGISNSLASAAGFIAPALIGSILGDDAGSQSKWILAFQITAALQFVALILFGIFATVEPQSWAKFDNEDEQEEDTKSKPKSIEIISHNLDKD